VLCPEATTLTGVIAFASLFAEKPYAEGFGYGSLGDISPPSYGDHRLIVAEDRCQSDGDNRMTPARIILAPARAGLWAQKRLACERDAVEIGTRLRVTGRPGRLRCPAPKTLQSAGRGARAPEPLLRAP
jgi:hypothetical protein